MTDRRKSVFNWNHISEDLNENIVKELKLYYIIYHKKCWAYKQAMKWFKKLNLLGNTMSILFASGGIIASIASGGIAIVAVSSMALIIQGWMKHQSLDMKIHNCIYAYQSYNHLLIRIKEAMRLGNFDRESLINTMTNIDNYVTDNSPVVDKFFKKYNEKFTAE